MSTNITETLFATKYKDDYLDSNHYHRILFNSGKVLQARELTQMQTIIQKEIERFGTNVFVEGAAVIGGGVTADRKYEFIKLNTATNTLPANPNQMVGVVITGASSGVQAKVKEVTTATGSDPATLFVEYTSTSSGVATATAPVRFTPGENLTNSVTLLTVQTTNTTANPAMGTGCKVSTNTGIFFVQGHFVQADGQSLLVSKYDPNPSVNIGFRVIQRVFTIDDDVQLYDNQGSQPNLTAPGADRYRIDMELALEGSVDSDEIYVFYAKLQNGIVIEQRQGDESYNKINDFTARRIREINGDFIVKPVLINYEEHPTDSSKFNLKISPGVVYLNGYRQEYTGTTTIEVDKATDTKEVEGDLISVGIGNYIVCDSSLGLPNIAEFEKYDIMSGYRYSGSKIGECRIKSIEEDGSNLRYYLMDIQMNSGQDFRDARSIGLGSTQYANPILENSEATLKFKSQNRLLFNHKYPRIQSMSDVSYTVLLRDNRTTDGSGNVSMPTLSGGDIYSDTTDWVICRTDTGALISPTITLSGGGTNAALSGAPSSVNIDVLYKKTIAGASPRTKTITNATVTTTVTTPATGAPYISLGKADIINFTRATLVDSDGQDVRGRFILDNGQRDNFYDVGRLVLKGNQSAPSGNIFVRFNYYAHGASGDFFAAPSYPSPYSDIPVYYDKDKTKWDLRNVIDFRSRKDDTGANFSGSSARYNALPTNTSVIQSDTTYYLPRWDKLISVNPLKYLQGTSSFDPQFPSTPSGALELYNIKMNSGSIHDSDMEMTAIEAKGFTMKEIARLENRIDRLEEYTALSLLENSTETFSVLDSSGIDRTKAGFLVDNFADHFSSDTQNIEYRASIDPQNRFMRPSINEEEIKVIYDSSQSTNTILKGDNVYLKYASKSYLKQNLATGTENINPFAVIQNKGYLNLSPQSDHWNEKKIRNTKVISGGTRLDTQSRRNFGNWNWNWGGVSVGQQIGGATGSTSQSRGRSIRTGTRVNRVVSQQTIREVVDEKIIDVALIPFMRSLRTYFRAQGLKPNTRHYAFFDGVDVNDWVDGTVPFKRTSSDGDVIGNRFSRITTHPDATNPSDRILITDAQGKVEGSFFIPNTSSLRFRAGSKAFELMDVTGGDKEYSTSHSNAFFTAQGQIQTVDRTVRATREISIRPAINWGPWMRLPEENTDRNGGDHDPLAQSFLISEANGVFITKVKIYFKTKDAVKPVQLQIRPISSGVPDNIWVPGAVKFLSPSEVNISNDATAATEFEFEEPVYLSGKTEYAIVLLAESIDYTVYVAETEKFLIGSTSRKVAKQPTMGSLFLSQNGSTWDPAQNKDMMFELYKASFSTNPGTAIVENANLPLDLLPIDAMQIDSSSTSLIVNQPNHGFIVGDTVQFAGWDSATTYGPYSGDSLNSNHIITKVDENFYTVDMDSAGFGSVFGGTTGLATQNYLYEIMIPRFQTLVLQNTNINLDYKLTNAKSLAGNEVQYDVDNSFTNGVINEDNYFEVPKLIANIERETNTGMGGSKSATLRLHMSTTDENLSPVVDMQRAGLWLIHNEIDFQDSAGSVGYLINNNRNNPIFYADEEDATGGSHLAKHVVKPIILSTPAVGAKILVSANKPSASNFIVYYKAIKEDENFDDFSWTIIDPEEQIQSDEDPNVFRDYSYLIGGSGGFGVSFDKLSIKIVMKSTNAAKPPVFQDLRVIALAV